ENAGRGAVVSGDVAGRRGRASEGSAAEVGPGREALPLPAAASARGPQKERLAEVAACESNHGAGTHADAHDLPELPLHPDGTQPPGLAAICAHRDAERW